MTSRRPTYCFSMIVLGMIGLAAPLSGNPAGFNYGGRLVDASGKPVAGTVDLEVKFFDDGNVVTGIQVGPTKLLNDVELESGVFNVPIELNASERDTILGTGNPVWIEIKDVTHNKTYPRQSFSAVPYALRVPVDGTTIDYNGSGQLEVLPGGLDISGVAQSALSINGPGVNDVTIQAAPGATAPTVLTLPPDGGTGGFVLKTNGSGALFWDNPATGAGNMDSNVYDNEGTAGVIDLTNGGTGANLSATGGAGQYLKQSSAGGAVTVGTIAAADIPAGIDAANVGLGNVDDVSVLNSFVQNDAQNIATDEIRARDAGGLKLYNVAGSAGLFVDDSGSVGVGTTVPESKLHLLGDNAAAAIISEVSADSNIPAATFKRSRGIATAKTIVASNSSLGLIQFAGYDGDQYHIAARIRAGIDGTPGDNDLPTSLEFSTTPDGSAVAVEQMRINNAGNVGIGITNPLDKLHVNGRIRATDLCDENGTNCRDLGVASSIGSVTSVGLTQPAAGLTVTGGPITTSGNMTLALANDLAAVEILAGTGIVRRTGADTWATLSDTAAGRAVLEAADATAQRSALGLVIGTNVQAYDATLGGIAATNIAADQMLYGSGANTFATTGLTSFGRDLLDDASVAAQRTTLGLAIGSDVQAYDATLSGIAAVNTTADQLVYSTGVNTFGTTGLSAAARTLLDDATTGDMLTTLGVTNPLNTFTQNAAQRVGTTEVRARDAGGLKLYDDSGAVGIFVEDGGQVGIGTTAPAGILDVRGTESFFGTVASGARISAQGSTGAGLWLNFTDDSTYLDSDKHIYFRTDFGGTPKTALFLGNTGNVGIGTTAPSQVLDVAGTIRTGGTQPGKIIIDGSDVGSTPGHMSIFENNGVIGIESRGHVQVFLDNDSDATSSQFTIGTNGLGSGLFGVYESGNVGIGTTSPDKALMVSSTDVTPIRAHRQVNSNGNVVSIIHSANDSGGNVTGYASTAGVIENSTDGAESGAFAIHTTAAGASTEKLRVSSAGNVGVGTAAPDAKLHVVGAVKIVDGTQGAGKVLTSDANGVASWQTASASPTIVTRYKTANETLANSAALQDDDDLTFSIGANEVWAIDLLLNFSANSVPDIQVAFNGPAGLDDLDVQWHTNDGMTGSLHAYETSFTYNNGNTDATAIIRGFVKNGATPGTFALRWAQNTSNATAIIMRAGSHLIAHKLN